MVRSSDKWSHTTTTATTRILYRKQKGKSYSDRTHAKQQQQQQRR